MKKRILWGLGLTVGIVAVAIATIVTVSSVNARSTQSDLFTKNLEALADNEGAGGHNHGPTKNPWFQKPYCANENNIDRLSFLCIMP